jgi:hypothetical protein
LSQTQLHILGKLSMTLTTELQKYIIDNNPNHNISNENCDPEIFAKGKPVIILDGRRKETELLVSTTAAMTKLRVDWHYSGGRAQVLYLGGQTEHRVLTSFFERNKLNQITLHAKFSYTLSDELFKLCFDDSKVYKIDEIKPEFTNYAKTWKIYVDDIQLKLVKELLEPLLENNQVITEIQTVWLPCENVNLLQNVAYDGYGLYRAEVG